MSLTAHTAGSLAIAAVLAISLILQATFTSPIWGGIAFVLAMLMFVLRWGIDVGVWLDRRLSAAPQT